MSGDDYSAAPLSPKQKQRLRIALTMYLFFMGGYTILHNQFSAALFYVILTVVDFYFYINISDWVRIKRK